jgi:hypothetical protein
MSEHEDYSQMEVRTIGMDYMMILALLNTARTVEDGAPIIVNVVKEVFKESGAPEIHNLCGRILCFHQEIGKVTLLVPAGSCPHIT